MALSDMPPPLRSAEHPTTDLLDARLSTEAALPHIATNLAFPDGPGTAAEAAEVLDEAFHQHAHAADRSSSRERLPWWKTPSPWWFMILIPLLTITSSAEQAPKIAIYTKLVCETHNPQNTIEQKISLLDMINTTVFRNEDPCTSDPVVQATVAKLQLSILLTGGVLGMVTAAWLSSFSDRRGRVFVMGIMSLSFFFEDFWVIFVTNFFKYLPGGYWFLVLGSVITGLLGGGSGGISGALHAYLADCTEPHERSRIFAFVVGVNWLGGAIGPTIGGLLTRHTGELLSSFYFSFCVRVFVSLMVWLVVPESLSKASMEEARRLHAEQIVEESAGTGSRWLSGISSLFAPLAVMLPSWSAKDRWSLRNWSLTFAILSLAMSQPVYGLMEFEVQYMMVVFKWTTEQVGYYLSITGTLKAVFLSLIFPAITLALNRSKPAIKLPTEDSEPLQPESSSNSPPEGPASLPNSVSTDLTISRISVLFAIVPYALIPFAPSALMYTALNGVVCFSTAFSPAIQSAALGIYTANGGLEAGKLFGAIGIVQTVGVSMLAPSLYGLMFMKTVGTFPSAIYLLSAGFVTMAFVFALLARPVPSTWTTDETTSDP